MATNPNDMVDATVFTSSYSEAAWVFRAISAHERLRHAAWPVASSAFIGLDIAAREYVDHVIEKIRNAPAHERKPSFKLTPLERAQQGRYAMYQPARHGGKSRGRRQGKSA